MTRPAKLPANDLPLAALAKSALLLAPLASVHTPLLESVVDTASSARLPVPLAVAWTPLLFVPAALPCTPVPPEDAPETPAAGGASEDAEEVDFVEQDAAGKDVFADIGKNVSIARRSRRTRGTLRFTPAFGPGGKRRIIAIVSRHGIPVHSEVVATYSAPKLIIPKKPGGVKVKRSARSAFVRWQRSKGATAYDVTLSLSDGRTISKRVKGRHVGLPRVARALDARIEVLPRGRQTITGTPARTMSKGKGPRPRVVRLRG